MATTEVVEVTSVELYGVATPTDGGDGSNNDGFINKLKSWWTNGIVGKADNYIFSFSCGCCYYFSDYFDC